MCKAWIMVYNSGFCEMIDKQIIYIYGDIFGIDPGVQCEMFTASWAKIALLKNLREMHNDHLKRV